MDTSLALAMVSLMPHFSWTWVGLVIPEDKRGAQFLSDLRGERDGNGICAAFVEMIPVPERSYSSLSLFCHFRIRDSSANVVFICGDTDSLISLNFSKCQLLVIWELRVTTLQWYFTTNERQFTLDSFQGTLLFSHPPAEIPGFENFI